MVSRTFKVGQAFGKRGVLSKATQAEPEAIGGNPRDDFEPYWDSGGTLITRPTYSATQTFESGSTPAARVANRITLTPTAVDPEGFPLTYSVDTVPANPPQLDSVSVTGNSFVFTPAYGVYGDSNNNKGSFKARLRASDGVRDVLDLVDFTLSYSTAIQFTAATTSFGSDWSSDDGHFAGSSAGFNTGTATNGGGAQNFASDPLRVGKYYFEVDFRGSDKTSSPTSGGTLGSYGFAGLYGGTSASYGYNSAGTMSIYGNNGRLYVPTYSGSLSNPTGDIMHYAYDSTARKGWIGISTDGSSITWATAGGTPESGNGYDLGGSAGGDIVFWFGAGSSGGSGSIKGYFRVGDDVLGTVPTGFTAH